MKRNAGFISGLAALTLCVAASCTIPGSQTPSTSVTSPPSVLISNYNGTFSYTVDAGSTAKDVYFVFSNTSLDTSASAATVANSVGTIKVDGAEIAASSAQPAGGPSESSTKAKDTVARIARDLAGAFTSRNISASKSVTISPPSLDVIGSSSTGSLTAPQLCDDLKPIASTCRQIVAATTAQGPRILNIWVADDCWLGGTSEGSTVQGKKHGINQTMVDTLAAKFLSSGVNNIYAYDTAILGPEWGSNTGYSYLIPFNNEITILLSDIDDDNNDNGAGGVTVGYFNRLNNYTNEGLAQVYPAYAGDSSERIMFVVDAVLYANPDLLGRGVGDTGYSPSPGWTPTNYWAEEVYSTLAHEFQHMIQFYQKGIVKRGDGQTADTWINEMCSQLVEDLVADKLGVKGPRGVDPTIGGAGSTGNQYGRIPYFNYFLSSSTSGGSSSTSLAKTSNYNVYDYSFSYAFGSWLMRNYGGAAFVKSVVYDQATDSTCITDAVSEATGRSETMADLISRWAVAVLGSNRTDMPPGYVYNTGTWTSSTQGGLSYNLGSINFFNYYWTPRVITATGSVPRGSIATASNVYYRAASSFTGSKTWNLVVPQGVGFSVFVTPHAP